MRRYAKVLGRMLNAARWNSSAPRLRSLWMAAAPIAHMAAKIRGINVFVERHKEGRRPRWI
jgi:hypothetical protein